MMIPPMARRHFPACLSSSAQILSLMIKQSGPQENDLPSAGGIIARAAPDQCAPPLEQPREGLRLVLTALCEGGGVYINPHSILVYMEIG